MSRSVSMNRSFRKRRKAFSLVEMMVALVISSTLMVAMMQALDFSWRGYKHTTEPVSTHVVTRIVMHRLLSAIRTGEDFGPFPSDYFDANQNPLVTNYIEFTTRADNAAGGDVLTRIERRGEDDAEDGYELWLVRIDVATGDTLTEHVLLTGVVDVTFLLEYEPGRRLQQATIDMTIKPNDDEAMEIGVGSSPPSIRMVASAAPRLQE